jgi:hypothetical protein
MMLNCGISVKAQRPNEKTRVPEWKDLDIVELTTEEFIEWWQSLKEEKDKIIVAETLRRALLKASDFGDDLGGF